MTSEITNQLAATKLRFVTYAWLLICANPLTVMHRRQQKETGDKDSMRPQRMRGHKQRYGSLRTVILAFENRLTIRCRM
jgi:hypothetical protein